VDVECWIPEYPVTTLVLGVVPEPNSLRHHLPPGKYRVELAATARNQDTASWVAEISFEQKIVPVAIPMPDNVHASIKAA
jgi:hypothetical protein